MNGPLVEPVKKRASVYDVLIIDPDTESVEKLKKICEQMECFRYIITAKDGSEASAKLNKQKFKLILMEMNLPKKNGLELIKIIESSENNLKSVMVVASEIAKEQIELLLAKGLKQILVKPINPENLTLRIKKLFA